MNIAKYTLIFYVPYLKKLNMTKKGFLRALKRKWGVDNKFDIKSLNITLTNYSRYV